MAIPRKPDACALCDKEVVESRLSSGFERMIAGRLRLAFSVKLFPIPRMRIRQSCPPQTEVTDRAKIIKIDVNQILIFRIVSCSSSEMNVL